MPYIFTSDVSLGYEIIRTERTDLSNSEPFRCIKNSCPSPTLHIHKQAAAGEACEAQRAAFIVILQLSTYRQDESRRRSAAPPFVAVCRKITTYKKKIKKKKLMENESSLGGTRLCTSD